MIRFFTLVLLTGFCISPALAQVIPGAPAPPQPGNFFGKIIDNNTLRPIVGASVQLLLTQLDSVTNTKKELVLATQVTGKKGEFNIEVEPILSTFKMQVSSIGYGQYETQVAFEMLATPGHPAIKDLGNIKLNADSRQLDNLTLTATRPLLEMYLDKKIYNVEKDLAATGGTAVDIFKNIPSVTVDLDGNVTMRNVPPQVLVDGRPSTLSLDQIPADQVAAVEIISNPSAKYDAGGGGAGILNIILKKTKKAGYYGNLRANIDSRGRPVLGGDVNLHQDRVNVFVGGQLFTRKNISEVSTTRTDFITPGIVNTRQDNDPVAKGYFASGRMGMDYFLDNRNTLTISGNLVRGKFTVTDLLNMYRDTIVPANAGSTSAQRNIFAEISFRNTGASLGFKHNFARAGHEWTADANYNESINTNTSDYNSQYYDGAGSATQLTAERATGGGFTKFYTFQTDLVYPLTKNSRLESGGRIAARDYGSWNDNSIKDPVTAQYIRMDILGVRYKFNDIVYAAYGTYALQAKKLSFQAGLRIESSRYDGNLTSKNLRFSNKFPVSLFPSFFLSKKLDTRQDVQFSYSRKINRPAFFQILPFVDFSDSLNLTVGNPALEPEFTQLAELNYSNQFSPGLSTLTTLYLKYTGNLITRYQYKAPNTDPTKPDSVLYNSYANASESYTIGFEMTARAKITGWWDLVSNLNLFDVTLDAANISTAGPDHLFSWFAKINNSFKLPRNYAVQLSGEYQARTILPVNTGRSAGSTAVGGGLYGSTPFIAQGYIKPYYGADIALKKEFLKNNAASLTLQFNDIFRTRKYATVAATGFFLQDNSRQRDTQVLRLNFSWRFGKVDAGLFKRKNMKAEMEGLQNMQQGQL